MNEITETKKTRTLKGLLSEENVKAQFALALPKHLNADRFARVAITALTRTPKLQECTPESFMKCLLDLSAMGLEPDGRRAHLIPYGKECTVVVDYKGKVELALRCGNIASIHADKVCENDQFVVNRGTIEKHVVDYKSDRGDSYAFYCLIRFKDGGEKSEVMTSKEVAQIRERSQGYKYARQNNKSHPWITDFDEMAKKTVFHRASKWIELSPEIREHFEKDYDLDVSQTRNVTPPPQPPINPFALSTPETAENAATVILDATEQEGGDEP
jgi:recombination protein RecT